MMQVIENIYLQIFSTPNVQLLLPQSPQEATPKAMYRSDLFFRISANVNLLKSAMLISLHKIIQLLAGGAFCTR